MRRLTAYSLAAGAFLASPTGEVSAQLYHVDFEPDYAIGENETLDLDLDLDGDVDLSIRNYRLYATWLPYTSNTWVLDNSIGFAGQTAWYTPFYSSWGGLIGGGSVTVPYKVSGGSAVSAGLNWEAGQGVLFRRHIRYLGSIYTTAFGYGAFAPDSGSAYLPIRFYGVTGIDYGWMRLEMVEDPDHGMQLMLMEYAFNATPGTPVVAGNITGASTLSYPDAMPCTDVFAADVAQFSDGRDLGFSFNPPADDPLYYAEYRVFAVKESEVASFDLAAANACPHYVSVVPSDPGSPVDFGVDGKDSDGAPIQNEVPYQLFVLSKLHDTFMGTNALSAPSDTVTLLWELTAPTAVTLSDAGNFGGYAGVDLQVEFSPATEVDVAGYRLIAVPEGGTMDLPMAESLSLPNYYPLLPTGQEGYLQNFTGTFDGFGNQILNWTSYEIYILLESADPATVNSNLTGPYGPLLLSAPTGLDSPLDEEISLQLMGSELWIEADKSLTGMEISLVDLNGRVLKARQFNGGQAAFDLAALPAGVYFCRTEQFTQPFFWKGH